MGCPHKKKWKNTRKKATGLSAKLTLRKRQCKKDAKGKYIGKNTKGAKENAYTTKAENNQ